MANQDQLFLFNKASILDQEYQYAYQIISSSPEKSIQDVEGYSQIQQMESQTNGHQKDFFFSEPQYIRKPQPKTVQILQAYFTNTLPSINTLHADPKLQNQQATEYQSPRIIVENSSVEAQIEEEKIKHRGFNRKDHKVNKNKKGKRQQYPTKNFLPSFRSSFINYLAANYGNLEQFYDFEIIKRIKGKPCINLTDYEDLFRVPQFRPILKVYFKDRVIVRDLMQSRIEYETKLIYLKKIHVFEEAFESGVFEKIN